MIVGILTMEIMVPSSRSLKEKRSVVKRFKDRLSHQFRVSVAEVGDAKEAWDRANIAVVAVSDDGSVVSAIMNRVVSFTEKQRNMELANYETRFVG